MKFNLIFIFLFTSFLGFGQGTSERWFDKYNVQTFEVLGHTFSVGDTLTLTIGSLPNGEFICSQLSPGLFLASGENPPHLSAQYINYKFIIEKIRHIEQGLNSQTTLVFYLGKKTPVWVDATLAISKGEILFK